MVFSGKKAGAPLTELHQYLVVKKPKFFKEACALYKGPSLIMSKICVVRADAVLGCGFQRLRGKEK